MRFLLKWSLLWILILVVGAAIVFYRAPVWVSYQQIRFHLWRSGVQSNDVQVDGYYLHYFEAAQPRDLPNRPLLLIHGLGAHGEDWAGLIPGLAAQGFHVYVPDLLGYGRSQQPDVDYSIALEEKIMTDFMATLQIPEADVAGWSMGGWIAMRLAVDHPSLVRRLVILDSAGTYFPPTFDAGLFVPKDSVGVARLMATLSPRTSTLPAFVARDVLRKLQRNGWVIHRSMSAMQSGRDLMDFRVHEIRQPTLIVWGSRDDLIPLAVGESIHKAIPQSSLAVIDGCGHLAPSECWRPTEQATLAFLTADPPTPASERHYQPQ